MPLRLFVIEPFPATREGIKAFVRAESDIEHVGEASDATTALVMVAHLKPDVVFLDPDSVNSDPEQLTTQIRTLNPQSRILLFTCLEDEEFISKMLRLGVTGYLSRSADSSEIVDAIRLVGRGGMLCSPQVAARRASTTTPCSGKVSLSERETEVMQMIAFGFSNKEIAVRLGLSVKTVETYKTRSMDKLKIRSRTGIVDYAIRHDWLNQVNLAQFAKARKSVVVIGCESHDSSSEDQES